MLDTGPPSSKRERESVREAYEPPVDLSGDQDEAFQAGMLRDSDLELLDVLTRHLVRRFGVRVRIEQF